MKYRCLTDLEQIKAYIDNNRPIAFDFETSPNELYRREDKAALDAHKAHIVGISFSVDEGDAAMQMLKEWCEKHKPEYVRLFELVQEYRKWGKLKSTYIDGYLSHINDETYRIHPDFMPLGTETGRFAACNPNLQTCPRKTNDPIGIRNFICAASGNVLMSLDFSQIELRVGAFYCRDEKMLETYRSGGDIHAQTTSVIFNVPFEVAVDKNAPDYKEHRTIAKNNRIFQDRGGGVILQCLCCFMIQPQGYRNCAI